MAENDLLRPTGPRLRTLSIIPGPEPGLGMIHAKKLVRALEATGAVENRTFFLPSGWNPMAVGRDLWALVRIARRFRPQVLHSHFGGKAGLAAVLAARLCGGRAVVHFRGSDLNPTPHKSRGWNLLMHAMSQSACFAADHRIFVSAELRGRAWFRGSAGRGWTILPSGYDDAVFFPSDRAQARRLLNLPPDGPVLAFLAGSSPKVKGEALALRTVDHLRRRIEFRFVSVGGDWPPDRVAGLMAAADALIFTSPFEGSPCVVQEALACGLPIASVEVGDVRAIAGGSPGVVFAERSPEALAKALEPLLRSPRRVPTPPAVLGASFNRQARQILDLYRQIGGHP